MACNSRRSFKIDEVMLLGNLHMVEHGEAERPYVGLTVPQLLARIGAANRRLRMRQVGHRVVNDRRFGGQRFHVRQNLILELADAAAVVLGASRSASSLA